MSCPVAAGAVGCIGLEAVAEMAPSTKNLSASGVPGAAGVCEQQQYGGWGRSLTVAYELYAE
jgi:hypothetical protein